MASHKGWDRHFVTIEGLAMKTGRSLNLATGQFGIVDMESVQTNRGLAVVSAFGGFELNRKIEMRLGVAPIGVTRSQSNKALSTPVFKISDVVDLRVDAPKEKNMSVDHFRIGFDGLNPDTAIKMQNGDNESIEIELSGKAIGLLGYVGSKVLLKLYLEAPNGDADFTDQQIVEEAVERFNKMTLIGGVPVTNYAEAKAVNSEAVAATGTSYTFFKLILKDNGDYTSLAKVQAQYPDYEVKREIFMGDYSTYVILAPTVGTTLVDYTEGQSAFLAECDECPAGFTLTDGICYSDATPVETAWEAGDVCTAKQDVYTITLADTDCGDNRLAELQAAYPELTITVATSTTGSTISQRTVTLTGTSGTANVTVDGTNYLATFATNLTTTANNFVTTHAATLLSAKGVTVTANAGVLTLKHATTAYPTVAVANVSGNLAGTLTAIAVSPVAVTGACLTTYQTSVTTDIVCADCSPLITELFTSEAPYDFDLVPWKKTARTYSPTALMGIDIKTKPMIFAGNEQFRDVVPYIASPVRLNISSGGMIVSESFSEGRLSKFNVKLLSRAQEPENYGGDFYDWENRGNQHFSSRQRFDDNNYGNLVLGQESHLKPTSQYVDYILSVRKVTMSQSFSGEVVENFNFHILAPVGQHQDVEDILNALATKAGIPTVQAYS